MTHEASRVSESRRSPSFQPSKASSSTIASMARKFKSVSPFPLFGDGANDLLLAEHSRLIEDRRQFIATGVAITDKDLAKFADDTLSEVRSTYGERIAADWYEYVSQQAAIEAHSIARKIPLPQGIVVVPHMSIPPEQRAMRLQLKGLIYASRGIEGVKSGFMAKRLGNFKFLPDEPVDLGISRVCKCINCGGDGSLTLHDVGKFDYRCECGHVDGRTACRCAFCEKQTRALATKLRGMVGHRQVELAMLGQKWRDDIDAVNTKVAISEQEMWRDFEVCKNEPGRSLRTVLRMRPKSVEDFRSCVAKVVSLVGNRESARAHAARIEQEAKRCKVFYEVLATTAPDITFESLFLATDDIRYHGSSRELTEREAAGAAHLLLSESPVNELAACLDLSSEDAIILATPAWQTFVASKYEFFSILGASVWPRREVVEILNPYYFGEEGQIRSPGASVGENLFRSHTERKAFYRLRAENPGAHIQSNRLLRQVIGFDALQALRGSFDEKEYRYLWDCELDFAVYSEDGSLVFVEEIQRGEHHDQADWVRKDAIKRRALKLAGVTFRESL